MGNELSCSFSIDQWDESSYSESTDGPQLIRASVSQTYSGALEGEGTLQYLITTFDDTFSEFVGVERVKATLDGKAGSFVLSHNGTHENGVAKSTFSIVPNSGTGKLKGIRGKGAFEASHEETYFSLKYYFE